MSNKSQVKGILHQKVNFVTTDDLAISVVRLTEPDQIWWILINTLQCHYNVGNFHQNNHNKYPVARPSRWSMGCLFWVQALIFVLPLSSKFCMNYCVILDCVIMALHCIKYTAVDLQVQYSSSFQCLVAWFHVSLKTGSQSPCTALTTGKLSAVWAMRGTIIGLWNTVVISTSHVSSQPNTITVIPAYIYTNQLQNGDDFWGPPVRIHPIMFVSTIPFFGSLEKIYTFNPCISNKIEKCHILTLIFHQNWAIHVCIVSTLFFFPF